MQLVCGVPQVNLQEAKVSGWLAELVHQKYCAGIGTDVEVRAPQKIALINLRFAFKNPSDSESLPDSLAFNIYARRSLRSI
jgi:hypothetical protein